MATVNEPIQIGPYWTNVIDQQAGELVHYEEVTDWWDGTPMDDGKVDGIVFCKRKPKYGGGYIKRISRNFHAKWWGIKPDADISSLLQSAINTISSIGGGILELSSGTYLLSSTVYLRSNVYIQGTGLERCVLRESVPLTLLLSSDVPSAVALIPTEDLESGAEGTNINNTISAGDLIRFKSTERFTKAWDEGVAIRDYYVNGELLKVKEATPTSVIFSAVPFLNFPISALDSVEAFTPSKGGGIDGVTLSALPGRDTYCVGLRLNSWMGFSIGKIQTIGFSAAGVQLNRCYDTQVDTIRSVGGSSALGLNYGLSINDGTKYTTVDLVVGVGNRHVVAAGGTGYAIPMYADIGCVIGRESVIYTADTHGNTAFFTFKSIIGNKGFSTSGIGHKVLSATVESGELYFAYEGGINLSFKSVLGHNISHVYSNKCIKDSDFNNINLNYGALHPEYQPFSFRTGSAGNRFSDIRINNVDFDPQNTNANNVEKFTSVNYRAMILQEGWIIDKLTVRGFPVAAHMLSPYISLSDFRAEDCGWDTGLTIEAALFVTNLASYGNVMNSVFHVTPGTTLTYATGGHIKSQAGGAPAGLTFININSTGAAPAVGMNLGSNFSNVLMVNVNLLGTSTVSATGRFIKNNVVTDSLPPPSFANITTYAGDLDALKTGGHRYATSAAANKPSTAPGFITVSPLDSNTVLQEFTQASTSFGKYYRICIGGSWSSWRFESDVVAGGSGARPATVTGRTYFDTSLGKPIWWSGSAWIDATGATV